MDSSLFRKPKPLVGLDIGSSAVKAIELKPAGKGYKVAAFAQRAGAARQHRRRRDHRRRRRGRRHPPAVRRPSASRPRDVAASLSGNSVIVKKITLPVMTDARNWPSRSTGRPSSTSRSTSRTSTSTTRCSIAGGADGKGSMEVLLVAAKKDKIADYTGVIAQAGRTAGRRRRRRLRAPERLRGSTTASTPGVVVALLNAGASAININIVIGEQSVFTRDISMGGNAYTEAVQQELNLPFETRRAGEERPGRRRRQPRGRAARAPGDRPRTCCSKSRRRSTSSRRRPPSTGSTASCSAAARRGWKALPRRSHERFGTPVERSTRSRRWSSTPSEARDRAAERDCAGGRRRRGPRAPAGGRPMIRINLLAGRAREGAEACAERSSSSSGRSVTLACSLILVPPALGVGWWCWALEQQSARLDGETAAPQRETTRLRSILMQVDDFEKQKQQLQQRVALIEELRKGQARAGAHPRRDQQARCPTCSGSPRSSRTGRRPDDRRPLHVADGALGFRRQPRGARGYFSKPVEILDSQVDPRRRPSAGELIQFSVKAHVRDAGHRRRRPRPARADEVREDVQRRDDVHAGKAVATPMETHALTQAAVEGAGRGVPRACRWPRVGAFYQCT